MRDSSGNGAALPPASTEMRWVWYVTVRVGPPPAEQGGAGDHIGPRRPGLPTRAAAAIAGGGHGHLRLPGYRASGSGRSWKCTILLFVPWPPSVCQM